MARIFSPEVESLIASFRAVPLQDALLRDAGAKPFGSIIESCVERYHIGRSTPQERILENWVRIVGPEYAARCRPERIDPSGALVVQVANATLRRELIFMEDRILTALGSIEGCERIRRVVLKAGL